MTYKYAGICYSHMGNIYITFNYCKKWCLDKSSMLGSMTTRRAVTIFHFWYQKMIFSFLFSYGSCSRPRSRTKSSARTQTKIICCFWLLQTTQMEEMKAGSTGTPVQLTPLSPICETYSINPRTAKQKIRGHSKIKAISSCHSQEESALFLHTLSSK